jgi:hypothetical protein
MLGDRAVTLQRYHQRRCSPPNTAGEGEQGADAARRVNQSDYRRNRSPNSLRVLGMAFLHQALTALSAKHGGQHPNLPAA